MSIPGLGQACAPDFGLSVLQHADFNASEPRVHSLLSAALGFSPLGRPTALESVRSEPGNQNQSNQIENPTSFNNSHGNKDTGALGSSAGDPDAAGVTQKSSPKHDDRESESRLQRRLARKRPAQPLDFVSKWTKFMEQPDQTTPFERKGLIFYQTFLRATLNPHDALGVDVWPHGVGTIKVDLSYDVDKFMLPADAPSPLSYTVCVYEQMGDEYFDSRTPPPVENRLIVFSIKVDVIQNEGLPRWKPQHQHFATLVLPSGQYIWSNVYRNYGAQFSRKLWVSIDFCTYHGLGTQINFSTDVPLWFTSAVRPEVFSCGPDPSTRIGRYSEMVNASRFTIHSLAATKATGVVAQLLNRPSSFVAPASATLSSSGVTALHLAAWRGPLDMVDLLASRHPEALLTPDHSSETPFDVAMRYARAEVADSLQDHIISLINPFNDYERAKSILTTYLPAIKECLALNPIRSIFITFVPMWWPEFKSYIFEMCNHEPVNYATARLAPRRRMRSLSFSAIPPLPRVPAHDKRWFALTPPPAATKKQHQPRQPTWNRQNGLADASIVSRRYSARVTQESPSPQRIEAPSPVAETEPEAIPPLTTKSVATAASAATNDIVAADQPVERGYSIELLLNNQALDFKDQHTELSRAGPLRLVIRISNFQKALEHIDAMRAAIAGQLKKGVLLLEFINPMIRRREITSRLVQPLLGSTKASRSNGMNITAINDRERNRMEIYNVRYAYTQSSYFPALYFQLTFPLALFPVTPDFDPESRKVHEALNEPQLKEFLSIDHWYLKVKPKSDVGGKRLRSPKPAKIPAVSDPAPVFVGSAPLRQLPQAVEGNMTVAAAAASEPTKPSPPRPSRSSYQSSEDFDGGDERSSDRDDEDDSESEDDIEFAQRRAQNRYLFEVDVPEDLEGYNLIESRAKRSRKVSNYAALLKSGKGGAIPDHLMAKDQIDSGPQPYKRRKKAAEQKSTDGEKISQMDLLQERQKPQGRFEQPERDLEHERAEREALRRAEQHKYRKKGEREYVFQPRTSTSAMAAAAAAAAAFKQDSNVSPSLLARPPPVLTSYPAPPPSTTAPKRLSRSPSSQVNQPTRRSSRPHKPSRVLRDDQLSLSESESDHGSDKSSYEDDFPFSDVIQEAVGDSEAVMALLHLPGV